MAKRRVRIVQELDFSWDFGSLSVPQVKDYVERLADPDNTGNYSVYDFDPETTIVSVEVS